MGREDRARLRGFILIEIFNLSVSDYCKTIFRIVKQIIIMLTVHLGCCEFQFFMLQSTLTSADKCCYKSKRYRSSETLVEDVLFEIV